MEGEGGGGGGGEGEGEAGGEAGAGSLVTREGVYRLLPSEAPRPRQPGPAPPPRLSLVALPAAAPADLLRLAVSHGKELCVYVYRGVSKAADLSKPIEKKTYKGTNPTCHDFNAVTTSPYSVSLLIGFSTGQIQILDPIKKEISKLYNEERLIDKTRVTCIRWVPGSCNLFLAAHASGQLYVYNEELNCGAAAPHYQPFKHGEGYTIYTCKTKSTRNPLYRWVVGAEGCCINEFAFSPCGSHLAVVSQDGFLRVFHYDTMELIGHARSYFGGFLCVCWSPDGLYVVVGGEDDLVTVWSFGESKVVARGEGHRSWVSVVAFDPYASSPPASTKSCATTGSDEELPATNADRSGVSYRLGSVSQDTQLCLWDITEDILRPSKSRVSAHMSSNARAPSSNGVFNKSATKSLKNNKIGLKNSDASAVAGAAHSTSVNKSGADGSGNGGSLKLGNKSKVNSLPTVNITVGGSAPPSEPGPLSAVTQRLAGFTFGDRKDHSHRRNFSLTSKSGNSSNSDSKNNSISNSVALRMKSTLAGGNGTGASCGSCGAKGVCDSLRLIGTAACPRYDDCPVLQPLVSKKMAQERLTSLMFREDFFLIACQDGGVYTWVRPGLPPPASDLPDAAHLFERDRHFERIDLVD